MIPFWFYEQVGEFRASGALLRLFAKKKDTLYYPCPKISPQISRVVYLSVKFQSLIVQTLPDAL